ncbi:hypothetical protein E3V08_05790 [Candidatus Atribacteria bacterium MT.SAG.1]|nr:hypothetical protein E3V08_05790 [Candidatus Atribacteria bacterium MT.SAG.1]
MEKDTGYSKEQTVVQYNIDPVEIPVFIFNHNYWVGFTKSMEERVRDYFTLEGKRTEKETKEDIYTTEIPYL